MNTVFPALVHGLITGGMYGAIALGLSLIFGVLRVINFAHGAFLMVSSFAYLGLWKLGLNPYIGIIIVAPVMFGVGYLIQNFMIKPLFKRERAAVVEPISVLMLTVGLGFCLDNLFLMIFGANFRTIQNSLGENYLEFGSVVLQLPKLIAFLGGIALTIVLSMILYKSELGKSIRAVAQNRDAAAICGVNVDKIYCITFGMGVATVSVAASFLSQFYYIQPQIGLVFGVKSFMIVVLGGLGSLPGALFGGLIFGVVESVGAQFMTSTAASMLSFLLFIIVLFVRPKGLLGKI